MKSSIFDNVENMKNATANGRSEYYRREKM